MRMNRRELLQASAALLTLPGLARAQQAYPTRPIRYIVPVAAGGGNDMIARVVTQRWGAVIGQPFVVDNQGGGGGVIASQTVARATPDGYTLMQGYVATHGTNPATRKVPYDPIKDFTPIGMIGATPNALVVSSVVPVKTVAEFIDYVKKNPGKVNYGSAGPGSLTHLTMELLKHEAGLDMTHIPYKGIAPAFNDLLGGQTQAMFPGLAAALPHLRSGRARAGDHRQAAQHAGARRADDGGSRLQRLRRDAVVRLRRPGRHAGRRREAPERDAGHRAQGS
jgi:tripartite-type tricarboxylate transporter receptor subunit TctC